MNAIIRFWRRLRGVHPDVLERKIDVLTNQLCAASQALDASRLRNGRLSYERHCNEVRRRLSSENWFTIMAIRDLVAQIEAPNKNIVADAIVDLIAHRRPKSPPVSDAVALTYDLRPGV